MLYLLHEAPPEEQNFSMVMEMIAAAEVHEDDDNYQSPLDILFERLEMREPDSIACKQYRIFKQAAGVVCSKRLLNQAVGKSLRTHNLKTKKGAQVMRKNEKIADHTGQLLISVQRNKIPVHIRKNNVGQK